MTGENKKLNIAEEVSLAEKAFKEGGVLLAQELYEGSTSRFYYAAFHLTQAVLLTKGLEARSHKGVLFLFRKHFVEPGAFEPRFSQILARSEKYREEADYRHDMTFSKDLVEQDKTEVREFMDHCLAFLKKSGYLD